MALTNTNVVYRYLLLFLMFGYTQMTGVAYADSREQAEAFEQLVMTLRVNSPNWWEDETIKKRVQSLAIKTGFDGLFENTLVKFNEQNIAVKIVVIEPNRIIYTTDGLAAEQIFTTIEDAVAEIYGVNKL